MVLFWSESHAVEGTQFGPNMEIRGAKSQLGWISGYNEAYYWYYCIYGDLILISKLTKVKLPIFISKLNKKLPKFWTFWKIPEKVNFRNLSENSGYFVRSLAEVPQKGLNSNCAKFPVKWWFDDDWVIGPVVLEKQEDSFIAQNTWTGDWVPSTGDRNITFWNRKIPESHAL